MTIESVAQMTHEEAVRATERIRLALDRVSTAWADLGEHLTKRIQLSLIFRAWNMRRTGKPMKFIRVNSPAGGLVPIPELR